MLHRLFRYFYDLFMGIDRASGEALASEAGYRALESFLDDNPDIECPWCGMSGYHDGYCDLLEKADAERRCLLR
jgi:hypothetical protein